MHAEELYRWNLQVSEAFLPALSCLEIALRNAVHDQLTAKYHRPDWWAVAPLNGHDADKVQSVARDIQSRRRGIPAPDDIVAELSFGFWVSLLSRQYDRSLWHSSLHLAFPGYRGDRHSLHDKLDSVRRFRNRIMHHEPVHHRHLAADHVKIYTLLGYIEPEAAAWLGRFDRVPEVLAVRPGRGNHAA